MSQSDLVKLQCLLVTLEIINLILGCLRADLIKENTRITKQIKNDVDTRNGHKK